VGGRDRKGSRLEASPGKKGNHKKGLAE
jgi:hypothetical protein